MKRRSFAIRDTHTVVKEMRLRGIKTREETKAFLRGYLPTYNRRFRVTPANQIDVHVRPERGFNLNRYLCIKTNRTVRNDNTVAYNRKLYQIKGKVMSRKVIVEERLNDSLHISGNGISLKYREITERPQKATPSERHRTSRKPRISPKDHPWRRSPNLKSVVRKKMYTQLTK